MKNLVATIASRGQINKSFFKSDPIFCSIFKFRVWILPKKVQIYYPTLRLSGVQFLLSVANDHIFVYAKPYVDLGIPLPTSKFGPLPPPPPHPA